MPIVEPPAPGSALSQGDILEGVKLYFTGTGEGAAKLVSNDTERLALVISRDCAVLHKNKVIVVRVARYQENLPKDMTFDDVLGFLEATRGGHTSPDTFYLGQLPNREGRYAAKLDAMYTIELPHEDQRAKWLEAVRVTKLAQDFLRDLHVRLFGGFAAFGFEDDRWFSDDDLEWVASAAQQALHAQEAEVAGCEAEVKKNKATGAAEERLRVPNANFEKAKKKLDELKERVRPLAAERDRRKAKKPT